MVYNGTYKDSDHMCDVICDEPSLLQMLSRFGIPLGVGDQTVRQVCEAHGVDTATFLSVANFIKRGARGAADSIDKVSVACLTEYLKQAHTYFLDFQLPAIRRKLLEAIDCSQPGEVSYLILKFYDDYMAEVRKHMQHENRKVFGYVEQLLQGRRTSEYTISQFARGHNSIDVKLQELKNIIIKYYAPTEQAELLNNVLYDIFTCVGLWYPKIIRQNKKYFLFAVLLHDVYNFSTSYRPLFFTFGAACLLVCVQNFLRYIKSPTK